MFHVKQCKLLCTRLIYHGNKWSIPMTPKGGKHVDEEQEQTQENTDASSDGVTLNDIMSFMQELRADFTASKDEISSIKSMLSNHEKEDDKRFEDTEKKDDTIETDVEDDYDDIADEEIEEVTSLFDY